MLLLIMPSFVPLSGEKLKTLRSLTSTKIRRRRGICLVEGERAIVEAARTGNLLYLVLSGDKLDLAVGTMEKHLPDAPCYTLDGRYFSELSELGSGIGVIGAARIPPALKPEEITGATDRCVLVYLDGLQEPGNVGGIIRTAWAFGAMGVLLGVGTADPFSAKGVRASAGGVFHVPVSHGVETDGLGMLREYGFSIYFADACGSNLEETRFSPRSILVLGNEARGFSNGIGNVGCAVGINMVPGADSLNVVVAGSIILERMTRGLRDSSNV